MDVLEKIQKSTLTFKAIINTDEIEFRLKFIDTFRFILNSLDI